MLYFSYQRNFLKQLLDKENKVPWKREKMTTHPYKKHTQLIPTWAINKDEGIKSCFVTLIK